MFKAIPVIPKKIMVISLVILFLVSMIFFISPGKANGAPAIVYVATAGNDTTGDGSSGAPFATIQKGINEVASGGTVNVAAGTYAEHITINQQLNLLGADKTTTSINGTNSGTIVTITGNNVTIKNFTIKNSGTDILENGGTDGGILAQSVTGVTIENNIFTNNLNSILLLASGSTSVKDNTLTGSARYGIVLDFYPLEGVQGSTPSVSNTISGNTITVSGRDGIYIGKTSNNNTITANTISGTTGTDETVTTGNGFEADGIYLWKSSGNTVTNNTISNNILGNGIEISAASNNNITSNTITGNLKGLLIRRTTIVPVGNTINGNTISGNTGYGFSTDINVSDPAIDATNNWWGDASGPSNATSNPSGTGNAVSDNVNFTPWLTNPVGYAPPPKPLTPEEQASLDLSIEEQVAVYGTSNVGLTKTLYDNILGRAADSEGLNDWVTALNEGSITLGDVVFGFLFSKELEPVISPAGPEEFMTFLYKNVLDRNPDPDGFNNWVTLMQNGMTKEEVLLHFIDSGEFKSICEMFGLKP